MVKIPMTGSLKTRIAVTNYCLTPDNHTNLFDSREVIFTTYACKKPLSLEAASRAMGFYSFQSEVNESPTHTFDMRNPPDMMINSKNWIYAKFRYGYQWFQVMGAIPIDDDEQWVKVYTRLDETKDVRSDPVINGTPKNFIEVDLDG